MTLTLTPINILDAAAATKPVVSYNDGTNNVIAHTVLDNTGALISPATSGKQDTANTALTAIQTSVANIPAAPATSALQTSGNASLASIATATANIPASPATAANQTTANTSLTTIATNTGNILAKGQATAANSSPVVLASDQTLPLPTGASTAAAQTTGNTSLATIATNTTGVATAANQTTGNTSLATIASAVSDSSVTGNLTAINQAVTLTGLGGASSISLQLGGTFVASGVVEYSKDNFATVKTASYLSPTGVVNTGQTTAGFYRYTGISGYPQARFRLTAYTSGTVVPVLTVGAGVDGGTVISVIPQNFQVTDNGACTTAAPTYTTGTTNPLSIDTAGNLRTLIGAALPAGTNIMGKVGIDQTTPGTTNGVQVNAALPAGTNLIGSVAPPGTVHLTSSPTVTAGAYTSGMVVGGLLSLTGAARVNSGSGLIQSAIVTVKTALIAPFDVFLFDTNPTNSTFTDNAALAINTTDLPFLCGVAHCTDLVSGGTPQVLQALNLAIPFKLSAAATTLYAVVVMRGGGETFASTSAISLSVVIVQD